MRLTLLRNPFEQAPEVAPAARHHENMPVGAEDLNIGAGSGRAASRNPGHARNAGLLQLPVR